MAVANTFTFGGVSTSAYGLVVEGPGDYSAPKRAVDTIEIPGRNGAFQLDKGYYENIELEYKVVVKEATQDDFLDSIDAFRNAIVSQIGYQRLEDTYHPGEYRMAMYSGGLDEDPQFHGNGAVFKVTFDCKPQRFLTSGETAVKMVTAGSTHKSITNPTLFESKPLLAVTGSGVIRIGTDPTYPTEYVITLNNDTVGEIELLPESVYDSPFSSSLSQVYRAKAFEDTPYALTDDGDTVTLPYFSVGLTLRAGGNETLDSVSVSFVGSHGISNYIGVSSSEVIDTRTIRRTFSYGEQTWTKGSGTYTTEDSVKVTCNITQTNPDTGTTSSITRTVTFKIRLRFISSGALLVGLYEISTSSGSIISKSVRFTWGQVTANSTQSVLGSPTYIDCDIGEAYKIVNDELISLNRYIELGSQLPVLIPGKNTVARDSTTNPTSILLTPRWWKI